MFRAGERVEIEPEVLRRRMPRRRVRDRCLTGGEDSGLVLGGTGDYEGATGTYEYTYTGRILYCDPSAMPAQYFGAISSPSGTWVINVPDNEDEQ